MTDTLAAEIAALRHILDVDWLEITKPETVDALRSALARLEAMPAVVEGLRQMLGPYPGVYARNDALKALLIYDALPTPPADEKG